MELATPRLKLRQWRDEDHEPFARLNADPLTMEFFPAPLAREASDAMIDSFRVPEGHPLRPHCLYRLAREDWAARAAARA